MRRIIVAAILLIAFMATAGADSAWRPFAEQGDVNAQFNLGLVYREGQGVPQDFAEAAKWFRKAAEQGHADAQLYLGVMYAKGLGVPQDYAEAMQWYRLAAAQGDGLAQLNLGFMYHMGQAVPQDYAEAIRWYRLAAGQGDAQAQFNLGLMYDKGQGVPQDYVQAVKWVLLAAEQGFADAQVTLGLLYHDGQGVSQDYVQAHLWFSLAAAQGIEQARKGRDIVAKKMTRAQIAEAQRLEWGWAPKQQALDLSAYKYRGTGTFNGPSRCLPKEFEALGTSTGRYSVLGGTLHLVIVANGEEVKQLQLNTFRRKVLQTFLCESQRTGAFSWTIYVQGAISGDHVNLVSFSPNAQSDFKLRIELSRVTGSPAVDETAADQ